MSTGRPEDLEVWWIPLPPGTGPPVSVFVNGRELTEGRGLRVEGDRVVFDSPLRARPALGLGRKVMLAMGIGVYGDLKGDSVDLRVTRAGRPELLSDLRPAPTPRPAPPPG
jgi:hypothetical protein